MPEKIELPGLCSEGPFNPLCNDDFEIKFRTKIRQCIAFPLQRRRCRVGPGGRDVE